MTVFVGTVHIMRTDLKYLKDVKIQFLLKVPLQISACLFNAFTSRICPCDTDVSGKHISVLKDKLLQLRVFLEFSVEIHVGADGATLWSSADLEGQSSVCLRLFPNSGQLELIPSQHPCLGRSKVFLSNTSSWAKSAVFLSAMHPGWPPDNKQRLILYSSLGLKVWIWILKNLQNF